jgi:hypothetical protein
MNEEDKKRLVRYMKCYVPESESSENDENIEIEKSKSKQNKLGFIDKIEVKEDILVKNIIEKGIKSEHDSENDSENDSEKYVS